jgi:hypothetical protein
MSRSTFAKASADKSTFAKAPADRRTPDSHVPDRYSLWLLTIGPTIWAAHLLLSYITAAVWCAKVVPTGGPLDGVHTAILWYTTAALIGIGVGGWEGVRRHRHGTEAMTHDLDTREDRHRFVGFATVLLSGLSGVGVVYAAVAAQYFGTCR